MIWIIDASLAVRWFIDEEAHPHADEALEKTIAKPENLLSLNYLHLKSFLFYNVYTRMDLRLLERESCRSFKEGYYVSL